MASWTLVQHTAGSSFTSASGTVTVSLPAAAGAGNLLVAWLTSDFGSDAFAGPAGWSSAVGVGNGTAAGTSRSEIWVYPVNPGGASSFTFNSGIGSTTNHGFVAEFKPPFNHGGVSVQSPGTGTAGVVSSLSVFTTVTHGNALALCCFLERNNVATTVTWTNPAGFTQAATSSGSVLNNSLGCYDLTPSVSTLTVTAVSGVNGTSATSWTGVTCWISDTQLLGGGGTIGLPSLLTTMRK
jgi:hypothetical protein